MECDVKPFSKPWKLVERDDPFEVQDSASRDTHCPEALFSYRRAD
jgi:hypothetical protein